jgi:hypothetical protein
MFFVEALLVLAAAVNPPAVEARAEHSWVGAQAPHAVSSEQVSPLFAATVWMATDGTGLKVLIPGLPEAHDGYIELYRNLSCAVFQYAATKASEDLEAKLKPFCGTLTADAEHRLNGVYLDGRVIEAGCNAYGVR